MEIKIWQFIVIIVLHCLNHSKAKHLSPEEVIHYRDKVKSMFDYAYDSYVRHAEPYDELKPITCEGMKTWGNFSLTLIDSMDSLILFKNYSEFKRIVRHVVETIDFNQNINVSVFETNIRVVGGLLSAHLLSYKTDLELEPGWPCDGPLLRIAEKVARKLLPAFKTQTGMPYGTVNLKYGVPFEETPITCTAGVGTFIVEFGTLSRLTGDPIFEETALTALRALHKFRSPLDLVGNHINTSDGKWTAIESSIGAGVDSYFEYLVKGALLFQMPELMGMFDTYYRAINKHMKRDDWYFVVHMNNGLTTMPVFQSLESFFPGLLSLIGEIDQAQKSLLNYLYILKRYGFIPEFFDVSNNNIKRNGYPLRPEFSESLFYLFKATKDPYLRSIGAQVIEAIEYSAKTECGYATIKNIDDHTIEDRMESFFLAETLKYLYLLFDDESFIHNQGSQGTTIDYANSKCVIDVGGYIFNTEAHPIDVAILDCCSAKSVDLSNNKNNINLFSLLGLTDDLTEDVTKYYQRGIDGINSNLDQQSNIEISIYPSSDASLPQREPQNFLLNYSEKDSSTSTQLSDNLQTADVSTESTKSHAELPSSSLTSNNLKDSVTQTSTNPWTPITEFNLTPSSVDLPTHSEPCDIITENIFTKPTEITSVSNETSNLESIPPNLNLSDFILQYEDKPEEEAVAINYPTYNNCSLPSHEILLCSPLPFLSPFTKYGQVLIRSES